MFDKRLAAKDFPTYVSQNAETARTQAENNLFGDDKANVVHVDVATRV